MLTLNGFATATCTFSLMKVKMEEKIAEIRFRFESELNAAPTTVQYNPIDIARVRTEDWQVLRYLLDANGDVKSAYRNLLNTLEWKQSFGLHKLNEQYFATEFYELYKVEKFGEDRGWFFSHYL